MSSAFVICSVFLPTFFSSRLQETTVTMFPNGINGNGQENGKQIWIKANVDVVLWSVMHPK